MPPRPASINPPEIIEKVLKSIGKAIKALDIYEKHMKSIEKPLKQCLKTIRNLLKGVKMTSLATPPGINNPPSEIIEKALKSIGKAVKALDIYENN